MPRTLKQQFAPEKVEEIHALIRRIDRLSLPGGSSRYYAVELSDCLQAGLLLASVHLAASLLELVVRGIVLERAGSAFPSGPRNPSDLARGSLEHRMEEMRNLGFAKMVDHLVEVGLFDSEDGQLAKALYRTVRIPLHHGLVGRFVKQHDPIYNTLEEFFGAFWPTTTSGNFEEVIEDSALPILDTVVGILERNST